MFAHLDKIIGNTGLSLVQSDDGSGVLRLVDSAAPSKVFRSVGEFPVKETQVSSSSSVPPCKIKSHLSTFVVLSPLHSLLAACRAVSTTLSSLPSPCSALVNSATCDLYNAG